MTNLKSLLLSSVAAITLAASPSFAQQTATEPDTQLENQAETATQDIAQEAQDATEAAGDAVATGAQEAQEGATDVAEGPWGTTYGENFGDFGNRNVQELIGTNVLSAEGNDVGEVDNFILVEDKIAAVVGIGGFLGVGEHEVALPLNDLKWDGENLIITGFTEEELKAMPEYDEAGGTVLATDSTLSSSYNAGVGGAEGASTDVATATEPPAGTELEAETVESTETAAAEPADVGDMQTEQADEMATAEQQIEADAAAEAESEVATDQAAGAEQPAEGEQTAADTAAEQPAEGEQMAADTAAEQPAEGEQTAADTAAEQPAEGEQMAADTAAEQPAEGEQMAADTAAEQPAEGEQMAAETTAEQPAEGEQTASETTAEQPAEGDQVAADTAAEPATTEQAADGWNDQMDQVFGDIADLQVAELIGTEVASAEGEVVGDVDNFALIGDQVVAVVGVGGFLGLGEHMVGLPLDQLTWDGERLVISGLTKEDLKAMPEYDEAGGQVLPEDSTLRGAYGNM